MVLDSNIKVLLSGGTNVSTSHSDTEKCDKSSADSFVTFLVGTSTTKYPIMTSSSPQRYSWQRSHDADDEDDVDQKDGVVHHADQQ